MHQLRKTPPLIHIHLQRERRFLVGQIAQISRIQFLRKTPRRNLRNHQRLRLRGKLLQQAHNLSQRGLVRHRHVAITAIGRWHHIQAIKLAVMLLPFQGRYHLVHQIIDVQQFQLYAWVIHRIRQVIRKRIAERCHGRIIIRPAPFAEEIREPVHKHLRACLCAIRKEQILPRLLASTVLGIAEPARK